MNLRCDRPHGGERRNPCGSSFPAEKVRWRIGTQAQVQKTPQLWQWRAAFMQSPSQAVTLIQEILTECRAHTGGYLSLNNIYATTVCNKTCLWFNSNFPVFNLQYLFNWKIWLHFQSSKLPDNFQWWNWNTPWIKDGFLTLLSTCCTGILGKLFHAKGSQLQPSWDRKSDIYNSQLQHRSPSSATKLRKTLDVWLGTAGCSWKRSILEREGCCDCIDVSNSVCCHHLGTEEGVGDAVSWF